jgi:hypothetical protein
MSPMQIEWVLLRTAQIEGLATVARESDCKGVVMNMFPDESLCVVPASSFDQRRWDVATDGQITRRDRFSGDRCRGNKFPKRILATMTRRVSNVIG